MKITVNFESPSDTELFPETKDNRSCSYSIYGADSKDGLVVYIPGFGDDLGEYRNTFCKKIYEKHQLAAMTVDYFCIGSRPATGAKIYFEPSDIQSIRKLIPTFEPENWLEQLEYFAEEQEASLHFTAGLAPPRGEYQNFGILAAIDIANAINDALNRFEINKNNVILIGSSYGDYLANLVAKIKPGTIKSVFDNSSWANPNLAYIIGRNLELPEFTVKVTERLTAKLFTKSPWTLAPEKPNSFEGAKAEIRSFSEHQIIQMAEQGANSTEFVFYHSNKDHLIAPVSEKVAMIDAMKKNGFEKIKLELFDEKDLEINRIKTLDHGMGLSMISFFDDCYEATRNTAFEAKVNSEARYKAGNSLYIFRNTTDILSLDIENNTCS
ncbi:DUF2920 family protein [Marinospirillum sp.]|uniref:DUF2920 family protein n=1 Tax=Marinospirillum sp. TaxID=2183934 RepID=UPI0025C5502D|nr:DUF2920 family protein [Marinospirillum sp.]